MEDSQLSVVQRTERIRRLTALGRALTRVSRPEEIPELLVTEAAHLLDAERSLLLSDDGEGTWEVQAVHGLSDRLFLWRRSAEEASESELRKELAGMFGGPFLAAPLVWRDQIFGLLAVSRERGHATPELDEWLLSAVADQAAVAMENVQLELEARRGAQREPTEFSESGTSSKLVLDSIRHDLRAPISAIGLLCELFEGELLGPLNERQKEAVQDIRVSAKHAESMALDLLDVGRLNAGIYELELATTGLEGLVEDSIAVVRPRALSRGQAIEVNATGACDVEVDPDAFRKVLVNVISNAVKYSPRGSNIHVTYGPDPGVEGAAFVRVRDEGPGIPAELHEAIFRPYFRIETEGETRGMGLGLAISRELLHRMSGSMELHSESGSGSTFTIRARRASEPTS